MDTEKLASIIGSLLFIHGEPMTFTKLAKTIAVSEDEVDKGIVLLQERYRTGGSGLVLIRKGKEIELATDPANTSFVEKLLAIDREESLGKAALEVLSIIAYRGPVSRAKIEAIRGVNCTFSLRNLLLRGYIERQTNPLDTREYEYSVSFQLLETLGARSVEELPDYESLSSDVRLSMLGDQMVRTDETEMKQE
jgi:segregation and condensation protein B